MYGIPRLKTSYPLEGLNCVQNQRMKAQHPSRTCIKQAGHYPTNRRNSPTWDKFTLCTSTCRRKYIPPRREKMSMFACVHWSRKIALWQQFSLQNKSILDLQGMYACINTRNGSNKCSFRASCKWCDAQQTIYRLYFEAFGTQCNGTTIWFRGGGGGCQILFGQIIYFCMGSVRKFIFIWHGLGKIW